MELFTLTEINKSQNKLLIDVSKYLELITHVSTDLDNVICERSSIESDNVIDDFKRKYEKQQVTLSAVIICKDEEKTIKSCIENIMNHVTEVVVVDTGSTDDTITEVQKINNKKIKIYNYEWDESFAEARNYAITCVKSDWLFFVDADEIFIENKEHPSLVDTVSFFSVFYSGELCLCPVIDSGQGNKLLNNARIFKKDAGYRYYGNVHEMLRKNVNDYEFVTNIGINYTFSHSGYIEEKSLNKKIRNISLLQKNIVEEPDNPLWKCYLLRDGMNIMSQDYLVNLGMEAGEISKLKNTELKRFCFNWSKVLLADISILYNNYDLGKKVLCNVDNGYFNESDIFYRKKKIQILEYTSKLELELQEVLKFKNCDCSYTNSSINTEGYHIDSLLLDLYYSTHRMGEYYELSDKLYEKGCILKD